MSLKKRTESNKKTLTYHDISAATKLGIGTISRYFNGGSISLKSKEKIEKFVQKNKFIPNLGAQLIKGYENCIYLLVASNLTESTSNIIQSIVTNFKKHNINTYIIYSSYDTYSYLESLKQTLLRKPKYLILFSPVMNKELRDFINVININVVIYGDNTTNKSSIVLDDEKYIYDLTTKILKSNSYKNIIYIGKNEHDISTGKLRFEGFTKAISKSKIKHNYFLIENNNFNNLKEIYKKLDIKTLNNKKTIVICGTNTIFRFMYFQKLNLDLKFELTDIGYIDDFDYLENTYKYKIFIDFYLIGNLIFQNIINGKKQNLLIKSSIISK